MANVCGHPCASSCASFYRLAGTLLVVQVYKVISEDYRIYALKEVYLKHVDPAIMKAYVNEIRLLKKLQEKPEIITLYD